MPRPCLKPPQLRCPSPDSASHPFASYPKVLVSPHVHFPPTPSLTSTHVAYSPKTYDRAPITISPNTCALPERGERIYTPVSESWSSPMTPKVDYFHPQAYKACEPGPTDDSYSPMSPPQLIPDLSSESDESDGAVMTPPDHSIVLASIRLSSNTPYSPMPFSCSKDHMEHALSFLPHPPTQVRPKESEKRRRSPSRPKFGRRMSARDIKSPSSFEQPSLDGCLGGF